jgi:hypothetical protein
MKTTLFTIFFSLIITASFAQDTITKFNNEKIIAKILEISPSEIKYKKFNFLDGPTYIDKKSDVKMIVFSNGMKEEFKQEQAKKIEVKVIENNDYYREASVVSTKIEQRGAGKFRHKNVTLNEREFHNLLINTKDKKLVALASSAKDAKAMQYVGFAAIPVGIAALLLFGKSMYLTSANTIGFNSGYVAGSAVCLVAAVACPIASGTFKRKRSTCNRAAVKLYNEKY